MLVSSLMTRSMVLHMVSLLAVVASRLSGVASSISVSLIVPNRQQGVATARAANATTRRMTVVARATTMVANTMVRARSGRSISLALRLIPTSRRDAISTHSPTSTSMPTIRRLVIVAHAPITSLSSNGSVLTIT